MNFQQLKKIEEEWFNTQHWYSDQELLEIFPEATEALKERGKQLCREWKILKKKIDERLSEIAKTKDDWFTKWFRVEIVNTFLGSRYREVNKEIKKLLRQFKLLNKPEEKEPDRIEHWQIELAKSRRFEDLIEVSRSGFAKCPFHKEKHASFYTRGGFGYCFSCGKHVDIISFVQETQNLSFPEAVKYLI